MKTIIVALMILSGCAAIQPLTGDCGIVPGGDIDDRLGISTLTQDQINTAVSRAIDGASFTTDFRLGDQTENCRKLVGYKVYTKKTYVFKSVGVRVTGITECWNKIIVVGTPADSNFVQHSALIHEIFHAMQSCVTPDPVDVTGYGADQDHKNWVRDNIYWAIDYETDVPLEK